MSDIKEITSNEMDRIIESNGELNGEFLTNCKFYSINHELNCVTALWIDSGCELWLEVFNSVEQAIEWLAN
jgi:hypothetical protein